jgi:CRISPR-associated endonuclease/helicase Cas3
MEINDYLGSKFRALTQGKDGSKDGYEPLHWQRRLFAEFCHGRVPGLCDLPTGMGKTSVIHLWWIALQQQMEERREDRLPTRLVYVVDRRTVVDQATAIAETIRENLQAENDENAPLSVSTLRGQFADNREWTISPSRPAIIIGTVDMIGSRLLFSGYRSSFKMRPLDAGLLGQDILLVLDEAHLSEPFAKLIRDLSDKGRFQRGQGKPMRVMRMSATASGDDPDWADRFKLEPRDLEGTAETNPIVKRYKAKKWLHIEEVPAAEVRRNIVDAATDLAGINSRVVVFVRSPDDATKIAADLKVGLKKRAAEEAVEVLTGTMRGLERDELLQKKVLKRFLDGEERPENRTAKEPAILVCTSAGEVGFDLNADHMVCDAAPLDSLIQRLGRVNRRGHADATIRMFVAKPDGKQTEKPRGKGKKDTLESATAHAVEYLRRWRKREADGVLDASPRAIHKLERAVQIHKLKRQVPAEQLREAFAPKPETVDLTDILLDAWSMTTIAKPMPGRPPVAAWLRGIEDGGPETTIAWRTELDLPGFEQIDPDDIEEWFDAHRILPHEVLSVPTGKAKDWMLKRWEALPEERREEAGERLCFIDRAGFQPIRLKGLIDELERNQTGSLANAQIVLPASFGGIERGKGLLDEGKPEPPKEEAVPGDLRKVSDVADDVPADRRAFRGRRTVFDGAPENEWLTREPESGAGGMAQFALNLPSDDDGQRQLVSFTPKRSRLEFGTTRQALSDHVGLVEHHAYRITGGLPAAEETEIREAVKLAAAWHDCGKDRDIWQRAARRKQGEPPVGKSGGSMGRLARGYRHEFGSLREFIAQYEGKVASGVSDLAAHLIAAHHGRARPHFPKGGFDPDAPAVSPHLSVEVIRRFARLQRKYGYWRLAYLENLLRCADAAASAEDQRK